MKKNLIIALTALMAAVIPASGQSFVDHGPAEKLVDISAELLAGVSTVTNNYENSFPEISDISTSARPAWGAGLKVKLNVSRFFALGTGVNVTFNTSRMDMAVTNTENAQSISNVFVRNSYRYLDFPVFASFMFYPARKIMWNVDCGLYYDFGLSGSSNTTIYSAQVNQLGQLITRVDKLSTDYFNDSNRFINSFYRSDIGLHLSTGLTFSSKISVGMTLHAGFKNVANTVGLVRPNCHNASFFVNLGYHF